MVNEVIYQGDHRDQEMDMTYEKLSEEKKAYQTWELQINYLIKSYYRRKCATGKIDFIFQVNIFGAITHKEKHEIGRDRDR